MSNINFSSLSVELTKKLSKKEKKEEGIFFTPPSTVLDTLDLISPYISDTSRILEPSCGSGEYVTALTGFSSDITAIEKNRIIYESISNSSLNMENVTFLNEDFLKFTTDRPYDLIIGNPPYFVMKKKDVAKKYYPYFSGRPNIFVLFIIHSLQLLTDKGILSFILPKSFLNCVYYNNTRQYINDTCRILHVIENRDVYLDTQQETIILIIQKSKKKRVRVMNTKFTLDTNVNLVFGSPRVISNIKKLYENSRSLHELGFQVNVGTVVWNQCKDILTDDNTKTRLIYSSDIINKQLGMKNYTSPTKKNYICKAGSRELVLVVNRGYGVGTYKFEYCLIESEVDYLIENHLIVIRHIEPIEKEQLREMYGSIITSLGNKRTQKFIELYFGNNAINTTEMTHILPIY